MSVPRRGKRERNRAKMRERILTAVREMVLQLGTTDFTMAELAEAASVSLVTPAFTLRTYAHALREEEIDLSFADFDGVGRPKTAQLEENENREASNYAERLARREGFEPPTLRFEGTAGCVHGSP